MIGSIGNGAWLLNRRDIPDLYSPWFDFYIFSYAEYDLIFLITPCCGFVDVCTVMCKCFHITNVFLVFGPLCRDTYTDIMSFCSFGGIGVSFVIFYR